MSDSDERKIRHVVKKKDEEDNRRTFHIYYDGGKTTAYELVEVTDKRTGKKTKEEHWVDRREFVRAGILKNQDFEAVPLLWRDKYKMRAEKLHDAEGRCSVCNGKLEIWMHYFDNDAEQRQETYNYMKCSTCQKKTSIPNTERQTPYDEMETREE